MFEQGQQIDKAVMPYLDQYSSTATDGYAPDMAGLRRDATRELDAEIMGGNQQGRLAGYQRRATDQQFSDEQNRFDTGLGLKRAELGETLRERGQDRMWQVNDRDTRLARLRKQALDERDARNNDIRSSLWGQIGGAAGTVLGAAAGGPVGGMAGGSIGAALGSAL